MKFFREQTSRFFRVVPGKRHNLVIVALENYPSGLFKTSIGITLLAAPLLLNFFDDLGVDSLAMRIVLNGLVIVIVPALILFIVTLLRAPKLRMKAEAAAAQELVAVSEGLEALKVQEQKDEDEVVRLKQEVSSNKDARLVKDLQEEQRWNSLNERLRAQEKTGQASIDQREERDVARQELAAEERLLVAQRVKDLTDEREVARQELASGDLKAQKIKDLKEDKRWDLLNEDMRLRGVEADKRDDTEKEEREFVREQLATAVLKAQQDNEDRNKEQENRGMDQWNMLHERLRIQEEKSQQREEESARRERDQQRRDDEVYLMRLADQLRDQYKTLLDRYIRYADKNGLPDDVANGIAPIPDDWLKQQPELRRDPNLFDSLVAYNERT